jgi:hypothetical protein
MSDEPNDEPMIRRTMQQILDSVPREETAEMSTCDRILTWLNTAGVHSQSRKDKNPELHSHTTSY